MPIKSSVLRDGFTKADKFFRAAGIDAARARELAIQCTNRYRQVAGANRQDVQGDSFTPKGKMLRGNPVDVFADEALRAIVAKEGVL
jgi:hypothetical protein